MELQSIPSISTTTIVAVVVVIRRIVVVVIVVATIGIGVLWVAIAISTPVLLGLHLSIRLFQLVDVPAVNPR